MVTGKVWVKSNHNVRRYIEICVMGMPWVKIPLKRNVRSIRGQQAGNALTESRCRKHASVRVFPHMNTASFSTTKAGVEKWKSYSLCTMYLYRRSKFFSSFTDVQIRAAPSGRRVKEGRKKGRKKDTLKRMPAPDQLRWKDFKCLLF